MDEKEAERRYLSTILTKRDGEEFVKAAKIKVAIRIFKAILEGSKMVSTEESVCHHAAAVTNMLVYLRSTLPEEKALRFDEVISPKVNVFEHFKPKELKEYQDAILKLVVVASKGYLLLVSEPQGEGSTK